MNTLKTACMTPALSLCLAFAPIAFADDAREAEQARLDQACEQAREEKLAPERKRLVEQCVADKERPDRQACERFYADYGNQSGRRAPLYMDLPACVKAFEYSRQDPSSG